MAWRCSGKSNVELITKMVQSKIIHAELVSTAMQKVDRANYVSDKSYAYEDSPQPIGHGATISAPHMHAYAVEHLLPLLHPGAKVLDVGSGSGYLTAVLHHIVSADPAHPGKVVGIEHVSELVDWSIQNLNNDGLGAALQQEQIEVFAGDGRQGYPAGGPYDAIHVGAAAPTLPLPLVEQLARPGRMFIPVGTASQYILQVDKDAEGNVTEEQIMAVRYVPLTDREKQKPW